ncbi:MAG: type II secretion system protein M [Limnobacter sp.]|nr:type II secretion system protein M [Limnobacter sp.]
MKKWQRSLETRLDELAPRERRLLLGGVLFGALALCWLVAFEPALQLIENAEEKQASLLQKASEVKREAAQLQALQSARSRVVVPPNEMDKRLIRLLADNNLSPQASVSRTEEGEILVELTNASAAGTLQWLAQTESLSNLTLAQTQFAKVQPGTVTGTFLFNQTRTP